MRYLIKTYWVALHILLIIILVNSDFLDRVKWKFNMGQKGESDFYQQMAVHLKSQDANVPDHSILFLGDSIVQGLCVSSISNKIINFGIGTDTTKGLLKRIVGYHSIQDVNAVILYIGGNDIGILEEDQSLENIKAIRAQIPPQIPIYICSILPVDEKIHRRKTNNQVNSLNKEIMSLCSKIGNVGYVDFAAGFKDSAGNLKHNFHRGDGLHLNQLGYSQLIASFQDYFRTNNPGILN